MASGIVTKASVANDFNNNVRNQISYNYDYYNPPTAPGGYTNWNTAVHFKGGLPAMSAGNVSVNVNQVTASRLAEDVRVFIQNNYSSIRTIRIVLRCQEYFNNVLQRTYDDKSWYAKGNLNSGFNQNISNINLGTNQNAIISTPVWNNAWKAWNAVTNNVGAEFVFQRHVNYGNHSSRIRR